MQRRDLTSSFVDFFFLFSIFLILKILALRTYVTAITVV